MPETLPLTERLLTKTQVAAAYAVHPKTVLRLEASGKIPKRLEGWDSDPRWLESEIVAHMRSLRRPSQN